MGFPRGLTLALWLLFASPAAVTAYNAGFYAGGGPRAMWTSAPVSTTPAVATPPPVVATRPAAREGGYSAGFYSGPPSRPPVHRCLRAVRPRQSRSTKSLDKVVS